MAVTANKPNIDNGVIGGSRDQLPILPILVAAQFDYYPTIVILSGAVFQAQRRISRLTGPARTPNSTTPALIGGGYSVDYSASRNFNGSVTGEGKRG
ncbi:MAG: hypothetical protein WA651_21415 [Candidatus Sulfotelmatobacter sp.]